MENKTNETIQKIKNTFYYKSDKDNYNPKHDTINSDYFQTNPKEFAESHYHAITGGKDLPQNKNNAVKHLVDTVNEKLDRYILHAYPDQAPSFLEGGGLFRHARAKKSDDTEKQREITKVAHALELLVLINDKADPLEIGTKVSEMLLAKSSNGQDIYDSKDKTYGYLESVTKAFGEIEVVQIPLKK